MLDDAFGGTDFIIPPVPNTLFQRDPSCWIYKGVTCNPMFWPARQPETLLQRAVYKFHPRFKGAAFSIFRGWTNFLVVIAAAALVVIIGIFFFGEINRKLVLFSLGCMTAGIIGNLYDRAFNEGRVRDFIDVYVGAYHWPTFNVADSLLCIGVGLLIITNLTMTTDQTRDLPQKEAH